MSDKINNNKNQQKNIIKQGAEAILYIDEWNGQVCLVKERFKKEYRHPDLDTRLTKERIRSEAKTIPRCQTAGVLTPKLYKMDLENRKIFMEYLDKAITVKTYIEYFITNDYKKSSVVTDSNITSGITDSVDNNIKNFMLFTTNTSDVDKDLLISNLAKEIGTSIGKMHANNIIHYDLTTSNMMLNPIHSTETSQEFDKYELIFIDFGLSIYRDSIEFKGVDLYVLERALLSTHTTVPVLFPQIIDSYKLSNPVKCDEIISKFEEVRNRGRKRTMVG